MKVKRILLIMLSFSLAGNVYLLWAALAWQKAWVAQILTTSDIEKILRKSGSDVSFPSIQRAVETEFGSAYKALSKQEVESEPFGPYENIIMVNDTKLYFNNNKFIGSKAALPVGLEYWWFKSNF